MKNKIPPPIVFLLCGAVMWYVAHSEFAYRFEIPFALAIAITLAAVGIFFGASAILQFSAAQTTINPLKPDTASSLVQSGVFGKTRNPMYLGLLLDLIAWGIWLESASNIVVLLVFVWLLTELQIKPEEAAMRTLFGDEYDHYCKRVRRWI